MERRTRTRAMASAPAAVPVAETHSPAFRLPTEIRVIIFEFADHSCTSMTYLTTVRLSQVCREWRKIISESPRLWTKLILSRPKIKKLGHRNWDWEYVFEVEHLQRDCSALSTYLHRSRQCSLCFYINQVYMIHSSTSEENPEYYSLYLKTFIPLLVDFIRRSRIVAFGASVYTPYNSNSPSPAPTAILDAIYDSEVLTNLCIAGTWPNGDSLEAQLFNRLVSLEIPDLRSLSYLMFESNSQLRHLTVLNEESWIDFIHVACDLTSLVTLHVNVHSPYSFVGANDPFDLPPMKTLPNLLRLCINFGSTLDCLNRRSPWSILDVLDLPSLVELELDMRRAPPEWASTTLQSFVQRSPLIRSLSYSSTGKMTTALFPGLRSATQLRHLRISVKDNIVPLLKLLSETRLCISSSGLNDDDLDIHTHPCVCPRLESLSATHYRSVPVLKMAHFVAARSSHAGPPCDGQQGVNNDVQVDNVEREIGHSRMTLFNAHFAVMGSQVHQESMYMEDPNISQSVMNGLWLNITKAPSPTPSVKPKSDLIRYYPVVAVAWS